MFTLIVNTICLLGLVIASYTDIRTREVPDWLNFALISAGLGLNLLFTIFTKQPKHIVDSLIGLTALFIAGWLMYLSGQWGGGDSKILMGIGALMGANLGNLWDNALVSFLINILLIGGIYGLFWSFILTLVKWKAMVREMKRISGSRNVVRIKRAIYILMAVILAVVLIKNDMATRALLLGLFVICWLTFHLWIYVKAVEKAAMLKYVTPDKLTEGDWIAEDVNVGKKVICGPRDLGIRKEQIKKLVSLYKKKKVRKILVKEGIPFVPSFLIAFIVTLFAGNLILRILGLY